MVCNQLPLCPNSFYRSGSAILSVSVTISLCLYHKEKQQHSTTSESTAANADEGREAHYEEIGSTSLPVMQENGSVRQKCRKRFKFVELAICIVTMLPLISNCHVSQSQTKIVGVATVIGVDICYTAGCILRTNINI